MQSESAINFKGFMFISLSIKENWVKKKEVFVGLCQIEICFKVSILDPLIINSNRQKNVDPPVKSFKSILLQWWNDGYVSILYSLKNKDYF